VSTVWASISVSYALVVGSNRDGTKPPVRRACLGSIASLLRYDVAAYITMQPPKMRRPTLSLNEIITDAPLAAKQYLKVMARQITWTQN
jgi:hypothetical protein